MKPLTSENVTAPFKWLTRKPPPIPFDVVEPVGKLVDPESVDIPQEKFRYNPEQRTLLTKKTSWYINNDPCPIPVWADREGYHDDRHFYWWFGGLIDFLQAQKSYEQYAGPLREGATYFEFGCASGRAIRHACMQSEKKLTVIGCDINSRHIEWMRYFLPEHIRIFQNTTLPVLPLADNSVDIATAYSVFTHIDDMEFAWLMELSRVLRPGGLFLVSIMSDRIWSAAGHDPLYAWFARIYKEKYPLCPISDDMFQMPMPEQRVVLWTDQAQLYNVDVFHHGDYVRREWGRFFEVKEIIPAGSLAQDLVVMQKRG